MEKDIFQMYLDELGEIEGCDEEENQRLLKELAGGKEQARNRLIEGNLKAVLEAVRDYLGKGVPAGDLVQEANMALVLAVEEYRTGEFSGFETFLGTKVRDALLAAVKQQSLEDETARKVRDRVNRLEEVSLELAEELGREATLEELARRMELTSEEVQDIMKMTLDAINMAEK